MFENWRFNPFSEVMNSVLIEEEEHTIEYHADWNGYGIQLNEGPQLDNPSSVVIVEDVSGGATFTEVPRTQTPTAGQYRVDYAASTYYGTGRVQFNAADNGKKVVVTYYGTGWTVKNNYRQSQLTVPTNMEVEEDATIHGDLDLDGENTGGGNITAAGKISATGGFQGDVTGNADTVTNGVYTTGAQTIAGVKTFSDGILSDVTGDLTGNADTATQADGVKETGSGAGVVHKKIIAIGDWNMDSTSSVNFPHGLTFSKIRSATVYIRDDTGASLNSIIRNDGKGGDFSIGTTLITIARVASGAFDNTSYDSTSYNRGWVVIEYID
jgi:hypothetical protein